MSKTRGSLPSCYWRSYSETSSACRSLTGRIQEPTTPAFNSRPATHRPCIFRELAKHTIRLVMPICNRQPSLNVAASPIHAPFQSRPWGQPRVRCLPAPPDIGLFARSRRRAGPRSFVRSPTGCKHDHHPQTPRPDPIVPRLEAVDSRAYPGRRGFFMYGIFSSFRDSQNGAKQDYSRHRRVASCHSARTR